MESTLTGVLLESTKRVYQEVDGEKLYLASLKVTGNDVEGDDPVEVIISEYLIPKKDCRTAVTFYVKTVKEPGVKLSTNYPFVTKCVEVDEDTDINVADIYGYITNKGDLKVNSRLGDNHITLILKYRSGTDRNANFMAVRAHGALARRLSSESKPSDHIKVNGIMSVSNGRLIIDVQEIQTILPSPLNAKGASN